MEYNLRCVFCGVKYNCHVPLWVLHRHIEQEHDIIDPTDRDKDNFMTYPHNVFRMYKLIWIDIFLFEKIPVGF